MREADTVNDVESNRILSDKVSLISSRGVCVVGMHKIVQPRNLGDPHHSCKGNYHQNIVLRGNDDDGEVRCAHSTEEVG